MTFGSDHYVPVLKTKRAEKAVLRGLVTHAGSQITPLMEIVERKQEKNSTIGSHLDNAFTDLADSLKVVTRCFLDARELAADGPTAAQETFKRAAAAGIVFAPVTGISRTADVAAAMEYRRHGLVLRLTRDEFEDGGLIEAVPRFLANHRLEPEDIDLVIDLGAVDELVVAGITALTQSFLADVPHHARWRTFTLSACSFPPSMGGVARNSHDFVERGEWMAWQEGLYSRRKDLERLPTFSDCAIQHPKGVEDFDFRTMQVSAAIRYTLENRWLLIKGESTRKFPTAVQFPALASRLVYQQLKEHFRKASHCDGCAAMERAANGAPKLGSAEAWRRLGTIHHLNSVIEQLEALTWP